MPCLKKLWLVVLVVLSASQFTKAQLASAQILSFADSIDKDSLSSRIHTFQHNDIIYYEAYDPDNGLVKVYGYSTTTTENKELFQIAHRAISPYFFELGDRVFYVHDSSVNRSLIFAKFHGLDPKREFGPDFLLRRSGPIHVGTEKRAYFYGESSKGKGAYFFNGKSGNFKLVKESDAVKTLNIIGTYLREVVIQDRSGTYMGPTKDSLKKISEVALGALIGDENGTFFVEKKELAQKIYYREKGKTTLREFAQLPVEEPFYGFQKIGDHLMLMTSTYGVDIPIHCYLLDPSASGLTLVAQIGQWGSKDENVHAYGKDKMTAFLWSDRIATYSINQKDSVIITPTDPVLSKISNKFKPVFANDKLYYVAFDPSIKKYYLCALSKDGKAVGYESSGFDADFPEDWEALPLIFANNKIYYFSSVKGGAALNVFTDNAFQLTFNCFQDANSNGIQDPGEIRINSLDLDISGFALTLQSNLEEKIQTILDLADYTIEPKAPEGWKLTTAAKIELKENSASRVITYNVGVTPKKLQYKMDGIVSNTPIRCGFNVWMRPKLINTGTRAFQGECCVTIDTLIDTDSIKFDEVPDTIIGNKYVWKYGKVNPTHFKAMRIRFRAPGTEFRGRTLYFPILYRSIGDSGEVIELVDTFKPEINCAYDPNDKAVWPDRKDLDNQTLHDEKLTYRIRFQNTGTDTAFNIVVEDTMSQHLDWSTFKLMDYSHKVETKFYDDGLVKFIFKNILLPDSHVNEPESHGFIYYTIKAKPGLEEWTEIKNTAHIYFDFNPAIVTNTTVNNMVSEIFYVSRRETKQDNKVLVYPNPSNGLLHIALNDPAPVSVKVLSSNGKEVLPYQKLQNGRLDVSTLTPGVYFISIVQNEQVLRASFVKR